MLPRFWPDGNARLASDMLIRDFCLRGDYFNRRSLVARKRLHYSRTESGVIQHPGYSPPEIDIAFDEGHRRTITVSELDIPLLCDNDALRAKDYMALILRARQGDGEAAQRLQEITLNHPWIASAEEHPVAETQFVVPCTTAASHSPEFISQKGSILLNLSQQGYPVPDFVVLTAEAYLDSHNLTKHIADAMAQLEAITLQTVGSGSEPLVLAIRCATPRYIPGVMDTYLNVGITESTLPALEELYGRTVGRRMFHNNLRNLYRLLSLKPHALSRRGITHAPERLTGEVDELLAAVGQKDQRLVEDVAYQIEFFVRQSYEDFEENRELVLTLARGAQYFPSIIMQRMVCTVRHERAYAGVVSSRNTSSGIGVELHGAHNIFGEEIMTGTAEIESTTFTDRQEIKESFPGLYHFVPRLTDLEREFESPVVIEFAVEATSRYEWFALLQLNEAGMAGRAALASAIDLHRSGTISRKRVTELIRPYHIKQLSSDSIDEDSFHYLSVFCNGVSILPRSAVSAQIYFSGEAALKAKSSGAKVCLCKKTFVPTDTIVMREMDAVASLTSAAIHVVTICQTLGIPALLSLEKNGVRHEGDRLINSRGRELQEGDWVTISSRRHTMYEGQARFKPARLLRYMRGEDVEFAPGEREVFDSLAYNYRFYQQLIKSLSAGQISSLDEITRLVNVELRSESEQASALVNGWFDERESLYVEEVLKSDIGDHLAQSRVFELLTLDRKTRFFKLALEKCSREHISGYEAGAFMIGRFLSSRYPIAFWKSFSAAQIALLINEWVLFEKYMQVLHNMGERRLLQARKKILQEGLDPLHLHAGNVKCFITLKLAGAPLDEADRSVQEWTDTQSHRVLDLLRQPYSAFYDFKARWSVAELEQICREEQIPVPSPDDA